MEPCSGPFYSLCGILWVYVAGSAMFLLLLLPVARGVSVMGVRRKGCCVRSFNMNVGRTCSGLLFGPRAKSAREFSKLHCQRNLVLSLFPVVFQWHGPLTLPSGASLKVFDHHRSLLEYGVSLCVS